MVYKYKEIVRKIHENASKGANHTYTTIVTSNQRKYTRAWFIGNSEAVVKNIQKQMAIKYPKLKSILLTPQWYRKSKKTKEYINKEYQLIFCSSAHEVCSDYIGVSDMVFGYFDPESSNYTCALQMMHRVGVILSAEFHFYIKPPQLKKVFTKKELMEANKNPHFSSFIFKHDLSFTDLAIEIDFKTGERIYKTETLEFKVRFDHEFFRIRSKALFEESFIYWNKKIGNVISYGDTHENKK